MESFRPNRSDIHLTKEEEAKIEGETRDYFEGIVPKRHTKPQRSEYSSKYVDALSDDTTNNSNNNGVIPELAEFQRLENDQQKLVYTGNGSDEEEFVETEYYKDLDAVDKQHHTTGTGFIKMDNTADKSYDLASDSVAEHHEPSKCNPATNDWIPLLETDHLIDHHSSKPNRSEG